MWRLSHLIKLTLCFFTGTSAEHFQKSKSLLIHSFLMLNDTFLTLELLHFSFFFLPVLVSLLQRTQFCWNSPTWGEWKINRWDARPNMKHNAGMHYKSSWVKGEELASQLHSTPILWGVPLVELVTQLCAAHVRGTANAAGCKIRWK